MALTTVVGWTILAGATISLASVLFAAPQRYLVFYLGIALGLLTIIILGESISSLSGLAGINWTAERVLTAATGFVMITIP